MKKIVMQNPIVEMDGDEMTRVVWPMIKDILIKPFVDLNTEYYDLHLKNRDDTDDKVTFDAAKAMKIHKVGVKNATITPNAARVKEYGLKKMWKSPNGTIRAILDGTVFRKPIIVKNVKPFVRSWQKPIIIGRHAYGDVYKNAEIFVDKPGKAELVFTDDAGNQTRKEIARFDGSSTGVLQGMHNLTNSITSFAKSCFEYALDQKVDLWFSSKDTISKVYDHHFMDVFADLYENEYKQKFAAAGIEYRYFLIDGAIAKIMQSKGGLLWACKNYDGDVMSDMLASSYGSLAMMSSILVSPYGYFLYDAAHGTVQDLYYKHLQGEEVSINSTALIFAWSGALAKRGEMDGNAELVKFAKALESATVATIEAGVMTGELAIFAQPKPKKVATAEGFLQEIGKRLKSKLDA